MHAIPVRLFLGFATASFSLAQTGPEKAATASSSPSTPAESVAAIPPEQLSGLRDAAGIGDAKRQILAPELAQEVVGQSPKSSLPRLLDTSPARIRDLPEARTPVDGGKA